MAIKSISEVLPFIYCYSTPGVTYHDGWVKIGYSEKIVDKRITDQTRTAGIDYKEEWHDLAVYLDGKDKKREDLIPLFFIIKDQLPLKKPLDNLRLHQLLYPKQEQRMQGSFFG